MFERTMSREELREDYLKNKVKQVNLKANKQDVYGKEDMLNLPRHRATCGRFVECPIDYKCRNFNSTYHECQTCTLYESGDVCMKKSLHNDKTFNMMITRPRVVIGEEERE